MASDMLRATIAIQCTALAQCCFIIKPLSPSEKLRDEWTRIQHSALAIRRSLTANSSLDHSLARLRAALTATEFLLNHHDWCANADANQLRCLRHVEGQLESWLHVFALPIAPFLEPAS